MPNSLADALSPYLRQHAANPVEWQQWGPEPFAEAARRDVPVFISIGYSTCHWCHVMARESFSDPEIARQVNAGFVAIKVDREEHPEVDSAYLTAASAFTQNLGWPLNVFATPEGRVFFAGTYWPPDAMAGHPSFGNVLNGVTDAWRNRRGEVETNAADVAAAIRSHAGRAESALPDGTALDQVVQQLADYEDTRFGGFGTAPKFPIVPVIGFLLDHGSANSVALADRTLTAMADSALRDPVEGGFFRYSTRADWTEPHFERMLYDNAQLLEAYARVSIQVPESAARGEEVAEGIVRFLLGTLRLPGGAFASAQNSESLIDGVLSEGGYYALAEGARANQPAPALDEKVLTGWNGLAISGLAVAGYHFDRADWIEAARRAADSIRASQIQESGELARATLAGKPSAARATLEDYGLLARGFLNLSMATGDAQWALEAQRLVDACSVDSGFEVPGGGDPVLAAFGIDADIDPTEGALPSGTSALAAASRELYLLSARRDYRDRAARAMQALASVAPPQPLGFGAALAVMSTLAAPATQLVVVSDDPDAELVRAARSWFAPGGLAITVSTTGATQWAESGFELLESRTLQNGLPAAYVCSDFVCRLPVTAASSLGSTST
ncbi:MAG: thioredoxin domain-containing protein [Cryobacterium sp.]|nr:thioredoxin domain-containing protein [Cryobacterium sp.]